MLPQFKFSTDCYYVVEPFMGKWCVFKLPYLKAIPESTVGGSFESENAAVRYMNGL